MEPVGQLAGLALMLLAEVHLMGLVVVVLAQALSPQEVFLLVQAGAELPF
jgi:hypothetical protein